MTSEKNDRLQDSPAAVDQARRDFVARSAAVGFAAAAVGSVPGAASAADAAVVETDVTLKMADGTCDAAFFHPAKGTHPGVLIWTDVFGLRPAYRAFGRRLAAEGFAVLVPNPFYRAAKAPVFEDASSFDFANQANRAKLASLAGPLNAPGAAETDGTAYIAWLDAQSPVNKGKKIGVQGYCMGGPLMLRTAAAVPDRVGAGASFHGGGLVTDMPDSPHLLAPKIKARLYIAIAASDDTRQPDAKDKLKAAFAAAKVPAEVVVYDGTQHGWCVPDMPMQNGMPIYSKPDAEKAWSKLTELYKSSLA